MWARAFLTAVLAVSAVATVAAGATPAPAPPFAVAEGVVGAPPGEPTTVLLLAPGSPVAADAAEFFLIVQATGSGEAQAELSRWVVPVVSVIGQGAAPGEPVRLYAVPAVVAPGWLEVEVTARPVLHGDAVEILVTVSTSVQAPVVTVRWRIRWAGSFAPLGFGR